MVKFFQKINLFPYSQFMRIGGKQQLDHTCGGVISLIIFLFIASMLSIKLTTAFERRTINYNYQNEVSLEPPPTTLSTFQKSSTYEPYMIAFNILQPFDCSDSSMDVKPFVYTAVGGRGDPNRRTNYDQLSFEQCTSEHFSVLPDIKDRQNEWGYSKWLCLPLNRTFELVGSQDLSNFYRALQFQFKCLSSCNSGSCGHVNVYHMNSIANPDNSSHPFSYRVNRNTIQVNSNWYYEYEINLDETIINTDNSLLPYNDISTVRGIRGDIMSINGFAQTTANSQTFFILKRSSSTTTINRSYLKLVDVLSYVGGIFPTIFAIFFFVNYFGTYFFEIGFAQDYFKKIEARRYGTSSYIRYLIYRALSFINCQPKNWVIIQKQEKIKQQVNKFLDFSYLFRRIDFLEKAVSVLFDKHQLKGLHLLHSLTLEEAESGCQSHNLRDRLVSFMNRIRLKRVETFQEGVRPSQDGQKLENQTFKSSKHKTGELKESVQGYWKRAQTENSMKKSRVSDLMDRIFYEAKLTQGQQRMIQNEAQFKAEIVKIGDMDDEEIREDELMIDMQTDLLRLFDEGRRGSDQRSKRIYEKIDGWLKDELNSLMVTFKNQDAEEEDLE